VEKIAAEIFCKSRGCFSTCVACDSRTGKRDNSHNNQQNTGLQDIIDLNVAIDGVDEVGGYKGYKSLDDRFKHDEHH